MECVHDIIDFFIEAASSRKLIDLVMVLWCDVQACWRAITAKLFCSVITFKATAKGPGKLENSAFRDLWLPGLSFILLMISVVSIATTACNVIRHQQTVIVACCEIACKPEQRESNC